MTVSSAGRRVGTRPFYGWIVVAGTFVVLFLGFGIAYTFAVFFRALQDDLGGSRGDVSLVFGITGFLYFSLGAISGPIADRVGPRGVVMAGVVLVSAGLLLASRAQALWQVYLTYGLGVGVGVGFAYVPAIGAVQRWFSVKRGSASGLAVTGIGLGTLVMPRLAAALIDATDWRTAYVILGALTLLAGGACALLIEHSPQRRGLLPDGGDARGDRGQGTGDRGGAVTSAGMDARAALGSRPFVLLYAGCSAAGVGLFIPFVHLSAYAQDHGLSPGAGAWLVSLIGLGSTAGRLGLGGVADRFGRRASVAGAFLGMALILVWWLASTAFWALALFAIVFGLCYGAFVALIPALTSDYFGGRNAGAILGVLYTSVAFGALLGPYLAGWGYDLRESYVLPILFGAAANLVAVACMLLVADPARWRSGASV